jgi:hypothetical protein
MFFQNVTHSRLFSVRLIIPAHLSTASNHAHSLCVFESLCLCVENLSVFVSLRPCVKFFIFGGALPSIRCDGSDNCDAADTREPFAALSGISRGSRHAKVSIQRIAPVFSPVISAGNLHKLQHFCILYELIANR